LDCVALNLHPADDWTVLLSSLTATQLLKLCGTLKSPASLQLENSLMLEG